MVKFVILNLLKNSRGDSLTPRAEKTLHNFQTTNFQTTNYKFSKRLKIVIISIKLQNRAFLAIGCSSAATGADGGNRGGSTVGVSSTSKNRPSHHMYKTLKGSKRT